MNTFRQNTADCLYLYGGCLSLVGPKRPIVYNRNATIVKNLSKEAMVRTSKKLQISWVI